MYPRRQNLTADVYPLLAELGDDHRHLGVAQVRRGAFDDHALELGRRMPHGVDLARRDERDAAVGPHPGTCSFISGWNVKRTCSSSPS